MIGWLKKQPVIDLEVISYVKRTTSDRVLLNSRHGDPVRHLVKQLWEVLYWNAGVNRWEGLHAFLCDLTNFETLIKRGVDTQEVVKFWWWFEYGSWTYLDDKRPFVLSGTVYEITFDPSVPSFLIERSLKTFPED